MPAFRIAQPLPSLAWPAWMRNGAASCRRQRDAGDGVVRFIEKVDVLSQTDIELVLKASDNVQIVAS